MVEQNIYPVARRQELVGIDVYYRLQATDYKNEYAQSIPYLEDAKLALQDFEDMDKAAAKHILIVAEHAMVAEKVALYLENHFAKMEGADSESSENLFIKKLRMEEQANRDYTEFNSDIEDENDAELLVWHFGEIASQDKEPGNIYLRILKKGGITEEESVFFTGVAEGEDTWDKVEAIRAVQTGNTYIFLQKSQVDEPWVADLQMCSGYKMVYIRDVKPAYYMEICEKLLEYKGYRCAPDCSIDWIVSFIMRKRGELFREENIEWCIDYAIGRSKKRKEENNYLQKVDFFFSGKCERSALETIEGMPGLEKPKKMIHELLALCQEESRNDKLKGMHRNMIFAGNPGTAKTTVAMLLGRMLGECGASNGSFVVATRADLIGEYVGKTAVKTAKVFEQARGGVLFIDEAAFLLNTDAGGFVRECVKEIVRFTEIYSEVMVIMACYTSEVEKILALDAGLASRFSRVICFEDYSDEILLDIADYMFSEKGYKWDKKGSTSMLRKYLATMRDCEYFGNAREVRKIVEQSIVKHAIRMMDNKKRENTIETINMQDVQLALEEIQIKTTTPRRIGF